MLATVMVFGAHAYGLGGDVAACIGLTHGDICNANTSKSIPMPISGTCKKPKGSNTLVCVGG